MHRLPLLIVPFMALAGLTSEVAEAHEIRPLLVEVRALRDNTATVKVTAPNSLLSSNLPEIVLSEDCSPHRVKAGSEQLVTCATPIAGSQIEVHYPLFNPAVSTMVRYRSSDAKKDDQGLSGKLYSPNESKLAIPAKHDAPLLSTYFSAGIRHILGGYDHLLFLVCLLAICTSLSMTLKTVTGFTLGHTATLILSMAGLGVPSAPVEALIAFSIAAMAAEALRSDKTSVIRRWPVLVAGTIGLLHGFGFAGFLTSLGIPPHSAIPAVGLFNLGVETGQLFFIGALFAGYKSISALTRNFRNRELLMDTIRKTATFSCGSIGAFWFIARGLPIILA